MVERDEHSEPASTIDGSGSAHARCLLAPNPSPMTLDGTNTWLVGDMDRGPVVVVDPGPDDEAHLNRVAQHVRERGWRVTEILLTHGHADHSAGARRFADVTGAPVRAFDPAYRTGAAGLDDGDVVTVGEQEISVLATPGHTDDSLCLFLSADGALLTGDTLLGRGTTVIAGQDGLTDYLASLRRLRALADSLPIRTILPGHGPVVKEPVRMLDEYLAHREQRLAQVRAALVAGDRSAAEVVRRVYRDVDETLWPAAEESVRAQLDYLRHNGATPPGV